MSAIMLPLNLEPLPAIPEDTRIAAWCVFGNNNFYIKVGDQGNSLFTGLTLIDPVPGGHTPVQTLAMLNLITIFQYMDTIPDQRVRDSLRKRVDWKYALHLSLQDAGLEASTVREFRKGLWGDQVSQKNMDTLLVRLSGIVEQTRKQHLPQETTLVIERVCLISGVARVWGAMTNVLGALAIDHPEWLSSIAPPHWYQRYSQRQKDFLLKSDSSEQEDFATAIGADGIYLLNAISNSPIVALGELPEVKALKMILDEQYQQENGQVLWRNRGCLANPRNAQLANSPESLNHT